MAASRGDASVPFTGATTEFDDVLMKHGIITKEQALLAKGMDVDSVAEILVKDKLQTILRQVSRYQMIDKIYLTDCLWRYTIKGFVKKKEGRAYY